MRIRDPMVEGEEPYNLVPLTDMVFNLLIFFMCATTFAQIEKDLKVELPVATPFAALGAVHKEVVVNILQDGSTVVAGKAVSLDELKEIVGGAVKRDGTSEVVVRADDRTVLKYFAQVAGACKQVGVGEVRLVYLSEK